MVLLNTDIFMLAFIFKFDSRTVSSAYIPLFNHYLSFKSQQLAEIKDFIRNKKAATRAILEVGASIVDLHNYKICQFESLLCTFVYLFFSATD
ncbi:hypothetical protein BpHYR1_044050 [Brachionus plicatilis]|uniref:Uncharacterized protein n=1 Tax=Brachionus plicatilis TaxID=10195 RepID=A0A3M7SEJ6_BRAPC|nr:hypothetical protein BpHYR1_044050 [Brachionus plicatilis]